MKIFTPAALLQHLPVHNRWLAESPALTFSLLQCLRANAAILAANSDSQIAPTDINILNSSTVRSTMVHGAACNHRVHHAAIRTKRQCCLVFFPLAECSNLRAQVHEQLTKLHARNATFEKTLQYSTASQSGGFADG